MTNNTEYWRQRAERYNNLQWVNSSDFIGEILKAGDFTRTDKVLDVGTGTGVIARVLSPIVRKVTAIDSSPDMMHKADGRFSNIEYRICDARAMPWRSGTFNRVVARYVFHHIIEDTQKAMDECYRVLKIGGRMVFAEGVPPSDRTCRDFIAIFKLKEDRLTFTPLSMRRLLLGSGFDHIEVKELWLEQMSVRNWLESSDLPKEKQDVIYKMHVDASGYFKNDYNMTVTDTDCLIDMRIAIVTGTK